MRTRDARFLGNGNFAIGEGNSRTRAWRLVCSRCQDIKVVALPHGNLPPDAIIKKFAQAGWYVAKKASDDLCGGCQKKRSPVAAPRVNGAIVPIDADDIHQTELAHALQKAITASKEREAALLRLQESQLTLMRVHNLLDAGQIGEAMQLIERWFPKVPWQRRNGAAVIKPEPAAKDDFDDWLAETEKQHRQGVAR